MHETNTNEPRPLPLRGSVLAGYQSRHLLYAANDGGRSR